MTVLDTPLAEFDPDVARLVDAELRRQQEGLEMIASENHAPLAVLQAQGSVLTNKYAEGYPGRRYYGGCEHVDGIERLAIERMKTPSSVAWSCMRTRSPSSAPPENGELGSTASTPTFIPRRR